MQEPNWTKWKLSRKTQRREYKETLMETVPSVMNQWQVMVAKQKNLLSSAKHVATMYTRIALKSGVAAK